MLSAVTTVLLLCVMLLTVANLVMSALREHWRHMRTHSTQAGIPPHPLDPHVTSYYFPGGHIFVVRGGDSQYVYIADSSPGNFQRMTHAQFLGMWQRFSAILTPH